jgi:hypothetical protein
MNWVGSRDGFEFDFDEDVSKVLRTVGIALAGVVAFAAVGVLLVRDQMSRHRRDLFSPHPLRRLAALGYIDRHPDVENAHLLRDFLSWERRPMLRRRAAAILDRMERALSAGVGAGDPDEVNGNGHRGE